MVIFWIPILPVRSFYIFDTDMPTKTFLMGGSLTSTQYRLAPLPGLGICSRSVGKTVFWAVIALTIFGLIVTGFKFFDRLQHGY